MFEADEASKVEVGGICHFICLPSTSRHRGPVIKVLVTPHTLTRLHVVPCASQDGGNSS